MIPPPDSFSEWLTGIAMGIQWAVTHSLQHNGIVYAHIASSWMTKKPRRCTKSTNKIRNKSKWTTVQLVRHRTTEFCFYVNWFKFKKIIRFQFIKEKLISIYKRKSLSASGRFCNPSTDCLLHNHQPIPGLNLNFKLVLIIKMTVSFLM